MTMITPSYLGETIEYSSLHACRSTLEDPTNGCITRHVMKVAVIGGTGLIGSQVVKRLTGFFRDVTDFPGAVYDRYSRVSLAYGRIVDRYIGRRDMTRLPMNDNLTDVVDDVIAGR